MSCINGSYNNIAKGIRLHDKIVIFVYIKLGKERQCHITKQLVHSFEVNFRIRQP